MIVNGFEQYNSLKDRMGREQCIVTTILSDIYYHRADNKILCAAVTFANLETFIVSVSHTDAPTFDFETPDNCLTSEDITALAYINNIEIPKINNTPYVNETYNLFNNRIFIKKIIPLMTWATILKEYNAKLWDIAKMYDRTNAFNLMTSSIKTLRSIENAGLCVDKSLIGELFGTSVARCFPKNFVYSQYNPYTSTGRPSNSFGGINFSALNKSDNTRDAFISRYENGKIVQLDFEAYHLRLIAAEFDITLPTGSLHTELAKIYFQTNEITEELYANGKRKTFEIMYGMSNETYGFELFEHVSTIRKMYQHSSGKIELPSGIEITVDDPTPSKLFNYYMQSLEFVKTVPKLQKILNLLVNTSSHLILYTYDSVLFDMESVDSNLLAEITSILEEDGKFPTRTYVGTTYKNIKEIRL